MLDQTDLRDTLSAGIGPDREKVQPGRSILEIRILKYAFYRSSSQSKRIYHFREIASFTNWSYFCQLRAFLDVGNCLVEIYIVCSYGTWPRCVLGWCQLGAVPWRGTTAWARLQWSCTSMPSGKIKFKSVARTDHMFRTTRAATRMPGVHMRWRREPRKLMARSASLESDRKICSRK